MLLLKALTIVLTPFSRTVEDDIIIDQEDSPEIIDDFELGHNEVIDIKDKDVNKQKLRRRISHYKVCSWDNLH